MKRKISEKDGDIIYSIRKNCCFRYENDCEEMTNSLPKKEWMSEDEEMFRIKALIEK